MQPNAGLFLNGFDPGLLRRAEEAGLNASAPTQQRLLDGWLLRLSPAKAKRARCVNALYAGQLPLDERIALAQSVFETAALPFIVRITPFSEPSDLDAQLEARGFASFDDTRVMLLPSLEGLQGARFPPRSELVSPGSGAFAEAVGLLRGSPLSHRQEHANRLRNSPVPYTGVMLRIGEEIAACGQFVLEHDIVGLYDVFTAPAHRNAGIATALCRHLLLMAQARGARRAYLQVEAQNHAARSAYERIGFRDGYAYHYRSLDPSAA